MSRDLGHMATGGVSAVAPVWMDWIDPVTQAAVSALGVAVLVLTIRAKLSELRLYRVKLHRLSEDEKCRPLR